MNDFRIRAAQNQDTGTLNELIRALAHYEKMSEQIVSTEEQLLLYGFQARKFFDAILCETIEGNAYKAVGFALYFFTYSTFVGRPSLYLEDLFVLEEYRGRGMGKALFLKIVQIAHEMNCGRVEWSVLNWNEPAIQFYKSMGAKQMSDWSVYRLDEVAIGSLVEKPVEGS